MVKKYFLILILTMFAKVSYAQGLYFIESMILSEHIYQNSAVIIQVKVFDASNALSGEVPVPNITGGDDFSIKKITSRTKQKINKFGIDYEVVENTYVAFFSSAGNYKLDPLIFEGIYNGENISFSAPAINFKVKDQPKNMIDNWRSAYELKILSGFDLKQNNVKVGDVIRRSIVIHAIGADVASFPLINIQKIKDMRLYESPVALNEKITTDNIEIEQTYNFVYIPQKVGKISIPDVKIKWLDLSNNKIKESVIAGIDLNVAPIDKENVKKIDGKEETFSFTIYGFCVLIASLLFLGYFVLSLIKYKKNIYARRQKLMLCKNLQRNCNAGDAKEVTRCAVEILNVIGEVRINNLGDIVKLFNNDEFEMQVQLLNEALFKKQKSWDGSSFYKIFQRCLRKYEQTNNEFPWLYPFK